MHYETTERAPGMRHDPFKALVVPRPIGWISTVNREGVRNLAPYSFFNGVSDRPPVVMFSSGGYKDTLANIEETGEFCCSIATWALRDAMNLSSATVARGVDEFALAGVTPVASKFVAAPRVGESPAAFECKLWKTVELPGPQWRTDPHARGEHSYTAVFGLVVGVYIDDSFLRDGIVDTAAMRPLARLGYMDYAVVTPETTFSLNRPTVDADGRSARVVSGPWDGVYR